MSQQYRMIPSTAKGGGTVNIGGKNIPVAKDTVLDVPIEIAATLHGWTNCGKVGTTSQRPTGVGSSERYVDTSLSKIVFSDGFGNWRDPFTGGIV